MWAKIRWSPPFLPQILVAFVLLWSGLVLVVFYWAVGILSQSESVLRRLAKESQDMGHTGTAVEKSAYAIIGIIWWIFGSPYGWF